MTILDIILLLCFVPAVVTGIMKGFVSQAVQVIAILLGAWAAFHFSSVICSWLSRYLTMDPTLLKVIAFVLVILVITLILGLIGNMLTRLLHALALGWLNGVLGVLFGILKVGIILGLLIMVSKPSTPQSSWWSAACLTVPGCIRPSRTSQKPSSPPSRASPQA